MASKEEPKRENLASAAFREQYANFYTSISQPALPEKLATKLYSKAIITSGARDSVVSVTGPGVTPAYRALTLLQILEIAITSEYKNLRRFVRVAKREDVLRPLAEKLYHRYRELISEHSQTDSGHSESEDSTSTTDLKSKGDNAAGKDSALARTSGENRHVHLDLPVEEDDSDEDDTSTIYQQGTPEELMGKIWYHGKISHKTAKKILKAESSDCFLLRDSTTSPGGFSLSLKYHGAIKHFIVDRDIQSDEYVIHGTKKSFPSIPELIDYYMHHSISAGGEKLWMPCFQNVSSVDQKEKSTSALNEKSLLKLKWRRCADLPAGMGWPHILRINNQIYCGGGFTQEDGTDRVIYKYDPLGDHWSGLSTFEVGLAEVNTKSALGGGRKPLESIPICPVRYFGLAELDGKLVLVGGIKPHEGVVPTSAVYVLEEWTEWKALLPSLPTARFYPSAFSYASTLIVCGGVTSGHMCTDAVEIYRSDIRQWQSAHPIPFPLHGMSFGIVHNTVYMIAGGTQQGQVTNFAYCAHLPSLIEASVPAGLTEALPSPSVWKVLPKTPTYGAAAAILDNCLFALGGRLGEDGDGTTLLHMYNDETESWMRINVGELPFGRVWGSAGELEAGGKVMLIGGWEKPGRATKTVLAVSVRGVECS